MILIVLYLVTTSYLFYIGRYETVYGAGVLSVIVIQALGLLLFALTFFLSKYNLRKSFSVFAIALSSIQGILIVAHEIEQYKPTYTISIPENYTGSVYLFVSDVSRSDVQVDENGIGYLGSRGKAQWELKQGDKTLNEAFQTMQHNEILIRSSDDTQLTSYDVSCLQINDLAYYPVREPDYPIIPCLDSETFLKMIEQGLVEENKLRKKVWNGSGNDKDWVLDASQSRL